MKMKLFILPLLILFVFVTACDSGPKVIEGQQAQGQISPNSIPSLENKTTPTETSAAIRKVVVEEILTTDKYNYLNVQEDDQKFWIAISKGDVQVGKTYYFRGGLLKKNFFSREFNRVFETVYLVSEIWSKKNNESTTGNSGHGGEAVMPDLEVGEIALANGAVALSDLFSNKEKYKNQRITITGKVVKVNPMIMNRNWLHIQDGSGNELDLTVTTTENVHLGAIITLEGTITLDKDFGSGYRYDIIMESATVVNGGTPINL
jgi:starvation-inducible outer membrane lipoprotein